MGDLLRRVQTLATQSNLQVRGFRPQAITTKEMHAEWPIALQLEGNYHNLGLFLDRVSKFPRIINIGEHDDGRQGRADGRVEHDDQRDGDDVRAGRYAAAGARGQTKKGKAEEGAEESAGEEVMTMPMRSLQLRSCASRCSPSRCRPCAQTPPRRPTGQPTAAGGRDAQPPAKKVDLPAPPPNFEYAPQGRRDPFVSLVNRGNDRQATPARPTAKRADGVPGMLTGELTVRGIMQTRGAWVAMVSGPDGKVYTVRAGDKLADGVIRHGQCNVGSDSSGSQRSAVARKTARSAQVPARRR